MAILMAVQETRCYFTQICNLTRKKRQNWKQSWVSCVLLLIVSVWVIIPASYSDS